jgi:rubrerythrin
MTIADVTRIGLALDDRLIEVYRESAENASIPEVREVFENLLEMEEEEKHTLVRAALESMDM